MESFEERIKVEIMTELGLFDKVKKYGWKSLTAKETGRIGGLVTKRKKLLQAEKTQQVLSVVLAYVYIKSERYIYTLRA